jgi:hypothetical protein
LIGAGAAPVRIGDEDVLAVGERRAAVPPRAIHGGRRIPLSLAGLRIGEIDQPVLREARVERHVKHAAETGCEHLGERANRRWIKHTVSDHAQSPGPFGHEHAAVGHERDSPGMIEALGQHRYVVAASPHAKVPGAIAERVGRRRAASPAAPAGRRLLRRSGSRGRLRRA